MPRLLQCLLAITTAAVSAVSASPAAASASLPHRGMPLDGRVEWRGGCGSLLRWDALLLRFSRVGLLRLPWRTCRVPLKPPAHVQHGRNPWLKPAPHPPARPGPCHPWTLALDPTSSGPCQPWTLSQDPASTGPASPGPWLCTLLALDPASPEPSQPWTLQEDQGGSKWCSTNCSVYGGRRRCSPPHSQRTPPSKCQQSSPDPPRPPSPPSLPPLPLVSDWAPSFLLVRPYGVHCHVGSYSQGAPPDSSPCPSLSSSSATHIILLGAEAAMHVARAWRHLN